jgi:outer membrane beta-barrel protein
MAVAQDLEKDTPLDSSAEIEQLYDKEEAKPQPKAPPAAAKRESKPVQTLSDLATLSPFTDVAIIQKRFLPKTKRFEFSATAFNNLNNPFFTAIGVSGRAAYYLREQHAVELVAAFAGNMERQVTTDLKGRPNGITTSNALTSNGFYALAYKWNPIYGKITFMNKAIVPFDLNFNIGAGLTQTTDKQSLPTLHMGTSQVFAMSKSMAFRWDVIWNMYQGDGRETNGTKTKLTQNDLFLGLGMSFYYPEASYR